MRDNIKGGALTEVTFFILLSLYTPRHGYGIMQFVEEATSGRLTLGAGTLYGALDALTQKGLIEPCVSGDIRKKEYVITNKGKHTCNNELGRLAQLIKIGNEIIGEENNG